MSLWPVLPSLDSFIYIDGLIFCNLTFNNIPKGPFSLSFVHTFNIYNYMSFITHLCFWDDLS